MPDKRQIMDADDTVGKRIVKALHTVDGSFLWLFDDGTYMALRAEEGCYHEDAPEIEFDDNPHPHYLKSLGVITEGECRAIQDIEENEQKEERRREYERLKKEFEAQG